MDVKEMTKLLQVNAGWRDERHHCITDPDLLNAAADALQSLAAERDALREDLAKARRMRDHWREAWQAERARYPIYSGEQENTEHD